MDLENFRNDDMLTDTLLYGKGAVLYVRTYIQWSLYIRQIQVMTIIRAILRVNEEQLTNSNSLNLMQYGGYNRFFHQKD